MKREASLEKQIQILRKALGEIVFVTEKWEDAQGIRVLAQRALDDAWAEDKRA